MKKIVAFLCILTFVSTLVIIDSLQTYAAYDNAPFAEIDVPRP